MTGFFEEAPGERSAMRLMCYHALWFSVLFGGAAVWLTSEYAMVLAIGFLLAAFAPKAVQKWAEVKTP